MCGAPTQGLSVEGIDVGKETVIQGSVLRDSSPVGGAYVRLIAILAVAGVERAGRLRGWIGAGAALAFWPFVAGLAWPGQFAEHFFAAPGDWTLLALAPGARGEATVSAERGRVSEVQVIVA